MNPAAASFLGDVPLAVGWSPLLAHVGAPVAPHDVLRAWTFEPLVVASLVLAGWLYARGVGILWHGEAGRRALPPWRAWCFVAAMFTLVLALISPLDALAETLFGAHMAQHLLLVFVAAPLLVLSRPLLTTSMALPPTLRRRVAWARGTVIPPRRNNALWACFAILVHSGTFWAWHLPILYEAALGNWIVHGIEHATLLGGGLLFWWVIADVRGRYADAAGVLAVFFGALQSGGLAALMTFGHHAWYPAHLLGAQVWGLTPLEDQQLAGGLMWFPGGLAYVIGGAVLFARWIRQDERASLTYPVGVGRDF